MNSKGKKVTSDFIYTVGATVVLNAVLQILVYPLINKIDGQESLGNVTYFMSIVNIATNSIGAAVGNNRLAIQNKYETKNSDYLIYLSIFVPLAIIVSSIILFNSFVIIDYILTACLILFACVKAYGAVQYRVVLNYKKYFFMFLFSAVGYLVGLGVFYVFRHWQIVFLLGELIGTIFVFLTGNVLKFDSKSDNLGKVIKSTAVLSSSTLIYEVTTNADRLILKNFDSANSVSLYYTVSSVPKLLFMLSLPINNIVLTYVANKKLDLNKKTFIKLTAGFSAIGVVFYLGSIIGIPIFMKIFYSNIWEQGKPFMFTIPVIVVIDLICSMIANLIFAKFGSKYHLMIFGSFLLYYAPLAIIGTNLNGIAGFVHFAIIAELIKYVLIVLFGIVKYSRSEKVIEKGEIK